MHTVQVHDYMYIRTVHTLYKYMYIYMYMYIHTVHTLYKYIYIYIYIIIHVQTHTLYTCITFPALQCTTATFLLSPFNQLSISSQNGLINSKGGAL